MARILIGWELGAGNGHSSRLLDLASVLAELGHEPVFAPQQIGPFASHWPTWQGPVWPRLLESLARRYPRNPQTMGDALAYLGLDDKDAVAAMLLAWDRLIADVRPDAIVAEYAPMLQLAARGRVPVLAYGTGFTLPPAQLSAFPALFGNSPVLAEEPLLANLNAALNKTGRMPLDALPQIFAADRSLVATFTELDPYRQWRRDPVKAPAILGPVPRSNGAGTEVFVYFNGRLKRPNAFWQALADTRLPVRVHDPQLTPNGIAALQAAGIEVARQPVPFATIVTRSRLLISHGGGGFVSSGLLAGLPQLIIPFDGEKRLNAAGVAGTAGCLQASFTGMEARQFTQLLRATFDDQALADQAQAASPEFRARMTKPAEVEAADLVESMLD